MSDYSVNFHIKAVDGLSKVFKGLGTDQSRAKKGFEKIDAAVNKNRSSLKRAIVKVRKFDRAINKVAKRGVQGFQKLTTKFGAFGSAVVGFLGAQQLGRFFADTINQASDLNEAANKSRIVFGGAFQEIDQWADKAATSIGLSKQEAFASASTMGSIFKNMGYGEKAVSKLGKATVKLAADLGSFHNLSTEMSFDKLRSGLMGETEPLKQIGIVLNETMVKQKAFEMGLISSTKGALSPAMKMQARYALIMVQSKDAMGDFARTLGDFASSKKILHAQIKDLTTELGEKLLPYANKFVLWLRNMATWVDKNRKPLKNWAKVLGVIGGLFIGLVLSVKAILGLMALWEGVVIVATAAQWLWNVALNANPIGLVILGIGALIGVIVLLYKNFDWVREKINQFWEFLKMFAKYWWDNSPFKWMLDVIDYYVPGLYKSFQIMIVMLKDMFGKAYKWVYDNIIQPLVDAWNWVKESLGFGSVTKEHKIKVEDDYDGVDDLLNSTELGGTTGGGGQNQGSSVSDRLASTNASGSNSIKNININIENLVRELMIKTENFGMARAQIRSEVSKALLAAVNDVNY